MDNAQLAVEVQKSLGEKVMMHEDMRELCLNDIMNLAQKALADPDKSKDYQLLIRDKFLALVTIQAQLDAFKTASRYASILKE